MRTSTSGAPTTSPTSSGREVWTGSAQVTKWEENKPARTALPFPDALAASGPGLYALIAAPGDGTSKDDDASAVQIILRTDLAPTIWRGSDGLTVQVRGYSDAKPRADVRLQLLAHNNDILAETRTDCAGVRAVSRNRCCWARVHRLRRPCMRSARTTISPRWT